MLSESRHTSASYCATCDR